MQSLIKKKSNKKIKGVLLTLKFPEIETLTGTIFPKYLTTTNGKESEIQKNRITHNKMNICHLNQAKGTNCTIELLKKLYWKMIASQNWGKIYCFKKAYLNQAKLSTLQHSYLQLLTKKSRKQQSPISNNILLSKIKSGFKNR